MESRNSYLLLTFTLILLFISCQDTEYSPEHQSKFGVYSVIDIDQPIEVFIWQTTKLGDTPADKKNKIVEILEDGNMVFKDTISSTYITSSIFPLAGSSYQIVVKDIEGIIEDFNSREIIGYDEPEILSYITNDNVTQNETPFAQTLQQIEIITDQSINNSPYYAYELFVDSLPNRDDKPYNLTSGWFKRPGFTCPEIGESPYLDRNLRIINLTCFEEENQFSIESTNHRAGDIDFVRFTLCNFDNHTMDFSRWLYQNSFFQAEASILQVINTKDNFEGEHGYDFILNRTCKEFILDFN